MTAEGAPKCLLSHHRAAFFLASSVVRSEKIMFCYDGLRVRHRSHVEPHDERVGDGPELRERSLATRRCAQAAPADCWQHLECLIQQSAQLTWLRQSRVQFG